MHGRNAAFVELARSDEEAEMTTKTTMTKTKTTTSVATTPPWAATPVRITPNQVQALDVMRGGKNGATVNVHNPWPSPPGGAVHVESS
jgi:hypothetical protein